jgi:dipeptidyl aminopeptidase/acylaminoacyl peptidase
LFRHTFVVAALLVAALPVCADVPGGAATPPRVAKSFDSVEAFGSRQEIVDLSLSPNGKSVAYVAALAGMGAGLFTLDLAEGSKPRVALTASGKPDRLGGCHWVSDERLVCVVYGVAQGPNELVPFTRLMAIDRTGGNPKLLSTRQNEYSQGLQLGGGDVLDWLPDEDGTVLMSRVYLPDEHLGTRLGSSREGLAVDHLNTRSLDVKQVELPSRDAVEYISDGRGTIRVIGRTERAANLESGVYSYSYRRRDSREWLKLSDYNWVDNTGFEPYAVDHDLDLVYGLKKTDGRRALYSISLDGALTEKLVYARPDVDVDGLVHIGRRNRVVGVRYATDVGSAVYFDADINRMMQALGRALPDQQLDVVDASVDEQTLLVFAGSDTDPGVYYVFDRPAKRLRPLLMVRSKLEGAKLAKVKSITYPAADGVMIPGYLTLPLGVDSAKGLPAIVLPHGGPSARDYWGFDWLSQYYAARGFAVLQPNFRGSAGYGDAWLQKNGFRSWRTAIGDVNDAGRWLVAQGADPAKLCIVGWSYGGYAALQSAVTEPGLFKAVVAIAPVTDLDALKEEHRYWSDFKVVSDMVGEGQHLREGSPARNADKIKVPVLLFHGALDRNVRIGESRLMAARLTSAGVKNELVTFDDLDHYLDDSTARTHLLRKSEEFLRKAIGEPAAK